MIVITISIIVIPVTNEDLEVKVTATRLSLKCKGQTILEGKLHEKVRLHYY